MLFLYSPIPGYALVCVDRPGETRSAPPALEKVAKELGDERNRNIDIKFLVCFSEDSEALSAYRITSSRTPGAPSTLPPGLDRRVGASLEYVELKFLILYDFLHEF